MLERATRPNQDEPNARFQIVLFLAAILIGCLIASLLPSVGPHFGEFVDPLVLGLVACLFFTLRLDGIASLRRVPRVALLAIGMNFVVIPGIAYALTAILIPDHALRVGVLIYCLAPCTDWFLGFTRLAGGDVGVGAALIPVQIVLQLALYPVWLGVFTGDTVEMTLAAALPTLWNWCVIPALMALGLRLLVRVAVAQPRRERLIAGADAGVPFLIAALIVCLFAANVATVLANVTAFGWVLLVVFVFFVITYVAGEGLARMFHLSHSEHALLTMTTSARNAPLMLAVTVIVIPDQPVVAAAIVLGMLIEFPHLTVLTRLLQRRPALPDAPPHGSPRPGVNAIKPYARSYGLIAFTPERPGCDPELRS